MNSQKAFGSHARAALLVFLLGPLSALSTEVPPTLVSTEDSAIDKAIDAEAKELAQRYASAGTKLTAKTKKDALHHAGILNPDSAAAKRLLAKLSLEYPLLIESRLTTRDISLSGNLAKLVRQQDPAVAAAQAAAKQAAQTLKTEAEVKTREAEAAAAAKTADAAEKQLVAKALTAAADTLAQDPATGPAAGAGGAAPAAGRQNADTPKTVESDTSVISGTKIQVSDSLKLVTTSLFAGRAYLWDKPWSLEVTSTLPGSTIDPSTSTTYSDAELQLPDGGILNIRIGLLSNLLNLLGQRQDYFEAGAKVPIYGDRASEYDRYYFNGGDPVTVGDKLLKKISAGEALIYFRDGLDFKGIFRPTVTSATATTPAGNTPSTKVGDYSVGIGYYAALGFDGGLFSQQQTLEGADSGNYRLEGLVTGQWVDARTKRVLYPNAADASDFSFAVGGRFVIVLTNHLNLDLQVLWPVGGTRRYMERTLIGGFSLTR